METQKPAYTLSTVPTPPGTAPEPRQLAAGQGAAWWGESWRVFCAAPAVWVGIFVLFIVVSIALVLVPLVGSLVHTVLLPVMAGGVMLGCDALARGEPLRIGHLFEGFQGGRFAPLCLLGLLWLAILFVVAIVMVATVFLTLGASGLAALMDFGGTAIDYAALASAGTAIFVVAMIALLIVPLFVALLLITRVSSVASLTCTLFGGLALLVAIPVAGLPPAYAVYAVAGTALSSPPLPVDFSAEVAASVRR